jgi:hypothetical protein
MTRGAPFVLWWREKRKNGIRWWQGDKGKEKAGDDDKSEVATCR